MTPSKLYKWSLALPVLVPVALLPLARSWRTAPGPVEWVLQVLVLSLVYGGVPYPRSTPATPARVAHRCTGSPPLCSSPHRL